MRLDPEKRFLVRFGLLGSAGLSAVGGLGALTSPGGPWIALPAFAILFVFFATSFAVLCTIVSSLGSGRQARLDRKRMREDFPSAKVVER
jgi:hypothetical protein